MTSALLTTASQILPPAPRNLRALPPTSHWLPPAPDALCSGDDADKRARVAELTAMLNDLQRELEPLRVRELDLIVEHEQLRAGISNSKLLLEGYLADISSLKAKRIKAEKEVQTPRSGHHSLVIGVTRCLSSSV